MQIQVRFFAALRERLGVAGLAVELPEGATVAEVWSAAVAAEEVPGNVLAARNRCYVDWSSPVTDGDEVAFFPPVTGGCA